MGTTPNYGWAFPDPTDLVKDLPADFELFADAVDADLADLLGGAAGTILTKATATDHDFAWSVPTPPALVPTGDSVYVRTIFRESLSDTSTTEDLTYYVPVYLPTGTIDRIGIRTHSSPTPTSGNTTRLGIYANSNGKPSTLILDAGTVNPAAASTEYEITISQAVTAGTYWLAVNRQVTVGTAPNFVSSGNTNTPFQNNYSASLNGNIISHYRQTGVTGAFANATGVTSSVSNTPIVWVRVA